MAVPQYIVDRAYQAFDSVVDSFDLNEDGKQGAWYHFSHGYYDAFYKMQKRGNDGFYLMGYEEGGKEHDTSQAPAREGEPDYTGDGRPRMVGGFLDDDSWSALAQLATDRGLTPWHERGRFMRWVEDTIEGHVPPQRDDFFFARGFINGLARVSPEDGATQDEQDGFDLAQIAQSERNIDIPRPQSTATHGRGRQPTGAGVWDDVKGWLNKQAYKLLRHHPAFHWMPEQYPLRGSALRPEREL